MVADGIILQFGEGKEIPTAYAFALVEHRQQDKIRLRMNLSGEARGVNVDEFQSCPRLLNMLPLITEVQRCFFIMKVFLFGISFFVIYSRISWELIDLQPLR